MTAPKESPNIQPPQAPEQLSIDMAAMDPQVADYTTVPEGDHEVMVAEVRPGTTRAGDERWSLRLVCAEGELRGRQAAWHSLVFSTRGRAAARRFLKAAGFKSKDDVQVSDLEGRRVRVTVRRATYTSPCGTQVVRNEVVEVAKSAALGGVK